MTATVSPYKQESKTDAYRILIIDSESLEQNMLILALQKRGFAVMTAHNGTEGIALAERFLPHLVIIETHLNDYVGINVMQRLKALEARTMIHFIMITRKPTIPLLRSAVNAGAVDCIDKDNLPECIDIITRRIYLQKRERVFVNEWMDKLRQSLSLTLSHEFRSPLATLLAAAEVLQNASTNDQMEEVEFCATATMSAAHRLHRHVERCLYYIGLVRLQGDSSGNDILSLRRVHSSIDPSRIKEVINKTIQESKASAAGLSVEYDLETTPSTVAIEIKALLNVIQELADNAFKFAKPQSVITISARKKENMFEILICNKGLSLSPQQIESIDAFIQFDRLHQEQQGLGIGLKIVKIIAEIFNASFTVESTPDGIKTLFSIPCYHSAENSEHIRVPFSYNLFALGYDDKFSLDAGISKARSAANGTR